MFQLVYATLYSLYNSRLLAEQNVSGAPTELHYIEGSVIHKIVSAQKDCNFELDVKDEYDVPIYVVVGFQERVW